MRESLDFGMDPQTQEQHLRSLCWLSLSLQASNYSEIFTANRSILGAKCAPLSRALLGGAPMRKNVSLAKEYGRWMSFFLLLCSTLQQAGQSSVSSLLLLSLRCKENFSCWF
ncbi:hypothetical protein V2G26_015858 [Clonostachys chloroleuca]